MSARRVRHRQQGRSLGGGARTRLRSIAMALSLLGAACALSPSPDLPGAENDAGSPPLGSGGTSASGGAPSNGGTGGSLPSIGDGGQAGDSGLGGQAGDTP